MPSKFLIFSTFFYLLFFIGLSSLGIDKGGDVLVFPEAPEIPVISNIWLIGTVAEFVVYITLVVGFYGKLLFFTFTDILHPIVSLILFVPMVILISLNLVTIITGGN